MAIAINRTVLNGIVICDVGLEPYYVESKNKREMFFDAYRLGHRLGDHSCPCSAKDLRTLAAYFNELAEICEQPPTKSPVLPG